MDAADRVQLSGWTLETISQATVTLSEIVTRNTAEGDPDGHAPAVLLVRWLACAAQMDPGDLAAQIEDLSPAGVDASSWDQLEDPSEQARAFGAFAKRELAQSTAAIHDRTPTRFTQRRAHRARNAQVQRPTASLEPARAKPSPAKSARAVRRLQPAERIHR